MPGLDGLDLARVLAAVRRSRRRSSSSPPTTSTPSTPSTCSAVDYVLKPVRDERLAEAVRRVVAGAHGREPPRRRATRRSPSSSAASPGSSHRSRGPLRRGAGRLRAAAHRRRAATCADAADRRSRSSGRDAGFVRIHRCTLVALATSTRCASTAGGCTVVVGGHELPVSRRHTRDAARPARPHRAAGRTGP